MTSRALLCSLSCLALLACGRDAASPEPPAPAPAPGPELDPASAPAPDPAQAPAPAQAPDPAQASGSTAPTPPAYPPVTALDRLQRMVDRCARQAGTAGLGTVVSATQVGRVDETPIYVADTIRTTRRVVIVGAALDPERGCAVYPVSGVAARATGAFLGGAHPLQASILAPEVGRGDPRLHRAALVVRDASGLILRAGVTPGPCEHPELSSVRLFGDRDSLALSCSMPLGGGGFEVRMLVFHAFDEALEVVLEASQGLRVVEPGEAAGATGKQEVCTKPAAGQWRVMALGERPAIEVFEPGPDARTEARPSGVKAIWTWDPEARRFAKGPAEPHALDAGPEPTCEAH